MAAQQPDFIALSHHIQGASAQIALIPNVPPIAVQDQLNAIVQQLGQIQEQLGQITAQLGRIQTSQDLLPMRFQNAIPSFDARLRYPPNIQIPDQAPRTKQQLLTLTDANCQIVSQALNLPVLLNNATIAQRRQQLLDYLGCGISA